MFAPSTLILLGLSVFTKVSSGSVLVERAGTCAADNCYRAVHPRKICHLGAATADNWLLGQSPLSFPFQLISISRLCVISSHDGHPLH